MRTTLQIELLDTVKVENILGEGVVWDERSQKVWWTDIENYRLYCYDPRSKKYFHHTTPERLGSFAFTTEKEWIIAAFENGFAFYNPAEASLRWLAKPQKRMSHIRFNDGRVDRQGRFWAGTMTENRHDELEKGCLYRLEKNGDASVILEGLLIPNSLCWSPDGSKVYFADSPLHKIETFDFDGIEGTFSNRKLFAETGSHIHPDGSTVDEQGYLWNAQWGGNRVVRYKPDGSIDHILNLPVSQPTCVAFGGPDLTWLFITTARSNLSEEHLKKEPLAGSLFIYKTNVKGITEQYVKFTKVE